jgi:hypothetical protein
LGQFRAGEFCFQLRIRVCLSWVSSHSGLEASRRLPPRLSCSKR